ncbi:hypothetical protein POUND7_006794 [Theobroma cacao]
MAAEFATSVACDFRNQSTKHELAIDKLQNEVNEARRQTEVIEHDVEDWLTKAREEREDVKRLLDEIEVFQSVSCLGLEILLKYESHQATVPGLEFIPSKDFMPSESSNSAFKEIMEALNNGDVNMMGLHRMGGVGKTTLAKEVGRQAKRHFNEVVIVTVSQTPKINNIQGKVADFLHLNFQKTNLEGRAGQLWLRIKDVKSILIILDDVWEELDLKVIGIPFGDDHKGCQIFLTTCLKQVCTRMKCQKDVHLNILHVHEAWALFKDNVGLKDVTSPLSDVAKEVARECKGLPLAIVTVGSALKDETQDEWKVLHRRLKDFRHIEH